MRLLQNVLFGTIFLFTSMSAFISSFAVAEILDTQIVINHSNFTLVSSKRVTRTVSEYTIRALANNTTAIEIKNVTATLISVPTNITIVDGNLNFGLLAANASVASSDTFTIRIDLRQAYSLADLRWKIEGDLPPPPAATPSAVGIFMSIDKNAIKGEVTHASHKDWIEVLTWSEGSSNTATTHTGGSTVGNFNLGDVHVMKALDIATVPLKLAIASGRLFDEVKIDVIKECGGNKYTQYAITLNLAIVVSSTNGGSGGQDRLVEAISFNTSSIETMYTPVGKDCRFENPIYSLVSYDQ